MKVAVNRIENKIVDLFPENENENNTYIISNGYIVLNLDNPIKSSKENEDGTLDVVYRELTDEDYTEYNSKNYKVVRAEMVNNIVVSYNDVEYQGDEVSQDRLSRAINGLPEDKTIEWKAKDNSKQLLTKDDLRQILYLAGQEQTRIWFSL